MGDFSIAQNAKLKMYGQPPQGTYNYIAPEVYKDGKYSFTIDIYSLGLILYRLLNEGRAPFLPLPPTALSAELAEMANERRLNGEDFPKPLHASEQLSKVILKACSFEPCRRYRSAKSFQRALEDCRNETVLLHNSIPVKERMRMAANTIHKRCESLMKMEPSDTADGTSGIVTVSKKEFENTQANHKKSPEKKYFTSAGDL